MVSEYANRKDRGKLVGMVFGTQALGFIVGPLVALALIGSRASDDVAWRVLLALGAVPAAGVIYLRCRMPESPRYRDQVREASGQARMGLRAFLTSRRRRSLTPAARSWSCGPQGADIGQGR
jgi:MFS transporter, PHS family, inorganic phosphate transporter